MKIKSTVYLAFFMGILACAGTTLAHHGTANYDTGKTVTVKGSVMQFVFLNPHVLIYMDGMDESGKLRKWQGELTSPNRLERVGWHKDTIKPGDVITISGYAAKSGSPQIWIQKMVGPNGEDLATGGIN